MVELKSNYFILHEVVAPFRNYLFSREYLREMD